MEFKILDIVGERILWLYRLSVAENPYGCRNMIMRPDFTTLRRLDGGDELRRDIANAQCVISGFLSPLERDVFRYCRSRNIPTIHVLARGTDDGLDRRRQAPPQLIVRPFDSAVTTINQQRAAWCNQYAMENAEEIVIGHFNPEGLLAFQLSDLPKATPVTFWREARL